MKKAWLLLLLLALCALPLAAQAEQARMISLNQTSLVLAPGATYKLKATVEPESAVSWESSDESVATVNNNNGRVTAVSEGMATITASTASGETAQCKVAVRVVPITSIKLDKLTATLAPGGQLQLNATWKPEDATAVDLAWRSSDPGVAIVDAKGLVSALGEGTTRVTVTAPSGKSAICKITVRNIPVTSVKLNRSAVKIPLGNSFKLVATVKPANAANPTLAWSSSNTKVATVLDSGLVMMVGEGKATITAKAQDGSNKKAACTVTSTVVRVSKFTLSSSLRVLDIGEKYQMKYTILPKNASFQEIRWLMGDERVATVDDDGVVTGVSAGVTTLTAKVDGNRKSATCTIRVRSGTPTEITITGLGDIILGGDPRRGTMAHFDKWMGKYDNDYSKPLERVQSVIGNDDVTIANLECVLTTAKNYKNKKYVFKGKPEYVNILTQGSVEVVNLANNHTLDYYGDGYVQTRNILTKAGVTYCGTTENRFFETKGVTIGFCGFTTPASYSGIESRCKSMKKRCDILVVSFHWNDVPEHTYWTTTRQRESARLAVSSGADIVFGHHTHVLAGIEVYKNKYIVYGLGNFVIPSQRGSDFDTLMFQQTFKVSDGFAEDGGIKVIPCSFRDQDENRLQPRILEGDEAERVLKKIRKYSQKFPNPADF